MDFSFGAQRLNTGSIMSTPSKMIRDEGSPRSLATGGSRYASPSTAATFYSPVETHDSNGSVDNLYQLIGRMNKLGLAATKPTLSMTDDPFVTTVTDTASRRLSTLSATAVDYVPGHRAPVSQLTDTSDPEYPPSVARSAQKSHPANRVQYGSSSLTASSIALMSPTHLGNPGEMYVSMSSALPSSTRPTPALPSSARQFTSDAAIDGTDSWTRYICLSGIDLADGDERLPNAPLTRLRESKVLDSALGVKKTASRAHIFQYDHLEDASATFEAAQTELSSGRYPSSWKLSFVRPDQFHGNTQRDLEAQVVLELWTYGGSFSNDVHIQQAKAIVEDIGDIWAWKVVPPSSATNSFNVRVEMAACTAADALVRLYGRTVTPAKSRPQFFVQIQSLYGESNFTLMQLESPHKLAHPSKSRLPQPKASHASTVVIPELIRNGKDVRTTVMIRNIPNKVDAEQFKNIINEHVFGKYDFSYLRIDFQNLCNVGYAFVNFVQAANIIPLYEAIVGRHWNIYNSDKVAEMCYATVQGLDCCIEKFRNSSVMLEWQPHRPKLWYTENDGELCGLEKDFPAPTNYQKLQRSRDNAAEVGLYPPRGINGYRYDSRQHISMFDRGHPRALHDDRFTLVPRGAIPYQQYEHGSLHGPLTPLTPQFASLYQQMSGYVGSVASTPITPAFQSMQSAFAAAHPSATKGNMGPVGSMGPLLGLGNMGLPSYYPNAYRS